MTPVSMAHEIFDRLTQASWEGAVFAVSVALICRAFRPSARVRAALWVAACAKFIAGLLLGNVRGTVAVAVPVPLVAPRVLPATEVWLCAGWLLGAMFCLLAVVRGAGAARRRVRRALPLATQETKTIVRDLSARLDVAPPAVRRDALPGAGTQVVQTGAKPVILLAENLLPPSPDALGRDDLRLLLAHEIAHIRRGDLLVGWLFALNQVLFFFHPLAAWARREWEAAREEACDALAVQCAPGDPTAPGRLGALLVKLGTDAPPVSMAGTAGVSASPFAALRRRLRHLNAPTAPGAGRGQVALLFGLVLLAVPVAPRFALPPVPVAAPVVVVKPVAVPRRVATVYQPLRRARATAPRPVKRSVAVAPAPVPRPMTAPATVRLAVSAPAQPVSTPLSAPLLFAGDTRTARKERLSPLPLTDAPVPSARRAALPRPVPAVPTVPEIAPVPVATVAALGEPRPETASIAPEGNAVAITLPAPMASPVSPMSLPASPSGAGGAGRPAPEGGETNPSQTLPSGDPSLPPHW